MARHTVLMLLWRTVSACIRAEDAVSTPRATSATRDVPSQQPRLHRADGSSPQEKTYRPPYVDAAKYGHAILDQALLGRGDQHATLVAHPIPHLPSFRGSLRRGSPRRARAR